MKILMLLNEEFPPDKRVENEIKYLTEAGHDIILACYTRDKKATKETDNKLTIYRMPINTLTYKLSVAILTIPYYFCIWKRFVNNIVKNEKPDAIHVHDLPLIKIANRVKKRHPKIKVVADMHENWPDLIKEAQHTNTTLGKILSPHKLWVNYEKTELNRADDIIAVVNEMENRLRSVSNITKPVHIVSNVVEEISEINNNRNLKKDTITLFYAGGLTRYRGVQVVIEGLKLLKDYDKKITLWVVGNGRYKQELVKLTESLGLSDSVIFFGHKPFSEKQELQNRADIGLIPHLRTVQTDNSSPNKLFEYMDSNIPVIAADCMSVKRIIDETRCGVSYSDRSPEEFAKALKLLIESSNNINYGKNGKEAIINRYNWELQKQTLIDIYNK
jgi:glycosyltransferase involved in cell wall biosynthesis